MTIKANKGVGLVLMLGLTIATQTAAAALRCGTELVLEGDTKQELLAACGQPDEGSPELDTGILVYHIDGVYYEVHLRSNTVERINAVE